jgi:hypothetical protein
MLMMAEEGRAVIAVEVALENADMSVTQWNLKQAEHPTPKTTKP